MTVPLPPQQSEAPSLEQIMQRAVNCHQAGQVQEAEALYQTILQSRPTDPDVNHNMGVIAVQRGQPVAALPYFKAALTARPDRPHHWLGYIETLIVAGQEDLAVQVLVLGRQHGLQGEAVESLAQRLSGSQSSRPVEVTSQSKPASAQPANRTDRVIQSKKPKSASKTSSALGKKNRAAPNPQEIDGLMALYNQGKYPEVILQATSLTQRFPQHAFCWKVFGHVLAIQGRLGEAQTAVQTAIELNAKDVEALNILGNIQCSLGQFAASEASYRMALQVNPSFVDAHANLGNVLRILGRYAEAAASCQRAVELKPDYAEAYCNLGNALHDLNRPEEAAENFRRALQLKPNLAEAHNSLGAALRELGQIEAATECMRKAIAIKPDYAEACSNLGISLAKKAQLEEAIVCCRRAMEIQPNFQDAHSNLIFLLDLSSSSTMAEVQEERKRWDVQFAAPLAARWRPHTNNPDPERRLRIGYVSADFKMHSASVVFGMMLVHFSRSQFDVYAYSNTKKEDPDTEIFKSHVSVWRNIVGMSDEAVAEQIRQDGIDILVDLSGHSEGNRLLVFARKPAPIQITAWGYAASTGMRAMDFFFADPVAVLPDEQNLFTEQVRYLPSLIGYFNSKTVPDINALPALSASQITFGSLNRLTKISKQTIDVWMQVLRAVPNSRLLLKAPELSDEAVRARLIQDFELAGVDAKRLTLLGNTSWLHHVEAFNQIDIALDPFPHGGGVTTLEGLMMGVPVVTLRWPTIPGRLSATILTTLELRDWIAESPEQYVEIASRKASDLTALAALRAKLRSMLTNSIIGDNLAYVAAVENEYRKIWREWCARQRTITTIA